MTALIEAIVVNVRGLVEQHLLASSLDWRHHLFVFSRQVVHIELLLLDKEEARADSHGSVPFTLQLKDVHALVIARGKVIKGRMSRHDPVAISVFARRVDAQATLHVPEAHGAILRVRQENLHAWMEKYAAYVARMAFERVHLPMFVAGEAPELYGLIIGSRC